MTTSINPCTRLHDDDCIVTVEIPVGLLHRAQCAQCVFSDYGSGDAEHDTLGDFVELAAAGTAGTGGWTLTAPITNAAAITASSLWAIAANVPADLGDTLEFQAQKGGGRYLLSGSGRYLLSGSVSDQPSGVAVTAAHELSAAVTAHLACDPVVVTVAAARVDTAAAAFVRHSS